MRLISLLSLAAALVAATPATPAAAREHDAPSLDRVGRALSDPQVQAGVAALVGAFSNAILDTKVGPLSSYARERIRPDDTLGDLARRSDPAFDRHLQERTQGAVAVAGKAARDGAAMQAELGKTAARLRDLMAATAAMAKAARDRGAD